MNKQKTTESNHIPYYGKYSTGHLILFDIHKIPHKYLESRKGKSILIFKYLKIIHFKINESCFKVIILQFILAFNCSQWF